MYCTYNHCRSPSAFLIHIRGKKTIITSIYPEQERSQGERGEIFPLPEPEKNLKKNGFISEGSIFSNKFSKIKIIKIQFFNGIFIKNVLDFLKLSNKFCFSSIRAKINASFLKFFEKYAKIMHFPYFRNKFFENFRKLSPPPRKNPGYS